VRVVVVHWNQPTECALTVANLLGSSVPVRVTVVDNASGTSYRAELERGLRDGLDAGCVEILDAPQNLGFGPGANIGLERFLGDQKDGEWVFLVPHDVAVGATTLEKMLSAVAQIPTAGLCCGDVGDGMAPAFDPYFGGMVVPGGEREGWEPADYPHGTLMGLRRQCLAEVGTFDERFFSYCEEADLALRARRRGWQVGLVRGAMVRNRNLGSSVWTVDYLQTRNTLLLVQEASGWYHAFIRVCFTLAQILRARVAPRSRPLVFDADARVAGVRDFTLRRFGPPPHR
jgi:GT2 family glycosyltransferase